MLAVVQGSAPITAIGFGPGGEILALSTASNSLALYRTDTCQIDDVSELLKQTLLAKLPSMSGAICCISFLPDATVRI
jgi:hypothetical protein